MMAQRGTTRSTLDWATALVSLRLRPVFNGGWATLLNNWSFFAPFPCLVGTTLALDCDNITVIVAQISSIPLMKRKVQLIAAPK
jgi:hypothetical protein